MSCSCQVRVWQRRCGEHQRTSQSYKLTQCWWSKSSNRCQLSHHQGNPCKTFKTGQPRLKKLWTERLVINTHALDPIRQPHDDLPQEYRWRCSSKPLQTHRFRWLAPKARSGDYEPTEEVRSIKATQLLRHVRRLESLRLWEGGLKKLKVCWNYDSTLFTLDQEWKAILKAKGFGMPLDQWVCKEVQWTLLPKYLPPLEWICALAKS